MSKIVIKKEMIKPLYETRFVKLFDLQYAEGKHYFDATRHNLEELTCLKSDEEFKAMDADAVSCILIVKTPDAEPRLFLQMEYRYPTGQFLLSPPAGLMDPEDKAAADPLASVTRREIFEETGIRLKDTDTIKVVNPLVFSTPGMTDESNAMVLAIAELDDLSCLDQTGAVGSEAFDGYCLLTKEEAKQIMLSGRDQTGNYYSVYTLVCLMYFVTGLWEE